MTPPMKETQMNELKQIRERFLADARQHFLADDTRPYTPPHAACCEGRHACSNANKPLSGRNLG
jgi:hypothetical protein